MGNVKKRKQGIPLIWFSGFAVIVALILTFGMIGLIMAKGLHLFWPQNVLAIELRDGSHVAGEVMGRERIPSEQRESEEPQYRILLKVGNRDLTGEDFRWIDEKEIAGRNYPLDLYVFERTEYGNLYGYLAEWRGRGSFHDLLMEGSRLRKKRKALMEELARLGRKAAEAADPESMRKIALREGELSHLEEADRAHTAKVRTARGEETEFRISQIMTAYQPNSMSISKKVFFYLKKFSLFLFSEPRESNTEGGILPAIFGTVLLVFVMTIAVVPLGVLSAVYLHEYAKPAWLVRIVRLAVSNLAGVPSIVFGIFGLGFFVYLVGGTIDQLLFSGRLPEPTFGTGGILWASLTLALLTLPVVIVATVEGLSAVPTANREGSLALSATKFQTIWNVVLPHAMPGILTGVILAVSRAAGEVAPLMLTGAVKLASSMPLNTDPPYLHLNYKFMHLGFHIYDVGFQSPNVEAAKPMVYATAFVLLLIVLLLNALAIYMRNQLRKRYKMASV
ncbi:MAG: phosphate ABC transporter permease PstA [Deltaproteobacteria bacterium]|nr:phosphate ABC transporter permease PstA [Deltaproteobacteria bacterium]